MAAPTPSAWILREALEGVAAAELEVEDGRLHLRGQDGAVLTVTVLLWRLSEGVPLNGIAGQYKVDPVALRNVLQRLAVATDGNAASPPPRCLHGAVSGMCAFAGCEHFRPDGPRDERWAFAPGTTDDDIAAAMAENTAQHTRMPGSASPIHLVVGRMTRNRLESKP